MLARAVNGGTRKAWQSAALSLLVLGMMVAGIVSVATHDFVLVPNFLRRSVCMLRVLPRSRAQCCPSLSGRGGHEQEPAGFRLQKTCVRHGEGLSPRPVSLRGACWAYRGIAVVSWVDEVTPPEEAAVSPRADFIYRNWRDRLPGCGKTSQKRPYFRLASSSSRIVPRSGSGPSDSRERP
jgi:hypothetical protein